MEENLKVFPAKNPESAQTAQKNGRVVNHPA